MHLDGEDLKRCPLRPMLDDPAWYSEVFLAHRWREKGQLPEPGTWKDQPAKLPGLMSVMDEAIADGQTAHHERQAKRQKGASGGPRPRPRPKPKPKPAKGKAR